MRLRNLMFAAALLASPAFAEKAYDPGNLPRELSDPATADKLSRMMGSLSRAFMNLPVGELEAAVEGRPVTEADRRKRVRDEIGRDGEREVMEEVAASGPRMRAMQQALVSALPAMMGALGQVEETLERAAANMPRPDYPRR